MAELEPLLAASRKQQLYPVRVTEVDAPPALICSSKQGISPTPASASIIKERLIFGSPADSLLLSDLSYPPDPFSELLHSPSRHYSEYSPENQLICGEHGILIDRHDEPYDVADNAGFLASADECYVADDKTTAIEISPSSPINRSKPFLSHCNKKQLEQQYIDDDVEELPPNMYTEGIKAGALGNGAKHLFRRSRTAPAIFGSNPSSSRRVDFNVEAPPSLSSPMSVVSQAFLGLMIYLSVGMLIYTLRGQEFSGPTTNGFFDALYFCIVTMCTIGYGDITPVTPVAKLFSCAFVLVGFGFIDILLSAMVSYVLQRQETLLLNSVVAGPQETAKNYLVDVKKGRMRIRSKVFLAFGVVVMCIGLGTLMMRYLEGLGWLDSFYLSCMSVTTVGYGDHAFKTLWGRVFASVWLLVSTLAVAQSFLYLAEARIDKRHRLIAKWVLEKEMTLADLLAADLDNDGSVSKSDFVVYKLKEMHKIDEKDITEICRQFSRLDPENSGKIMLSCLLNLHKASTHK